MSDEAQGSFQKDPLFDNGNATYTYEDALFEQKFSDRYKNIRNCNDFIYQLQEATALSDSEKKLLLAESRFLRAMHYFTLVKRYGGVPLIDEPQQYDPNNLEALMVPRNKEVEIYDFIVKECQEAAQDLPETREAEAKYRANRYVALSLCSRAALYAGSIARYGTVQQEGLVGIPASEADRFFQTSYEASKAIITSGKYALYNNKPDNKAQNFCDMFLWNRLHIHMLPPIQVSGRYRIPNHRHDKRTVRYVCPSRDLCLLQRYIASGRYILRYHRYLSGTYEYVDGSKGTLKLEENGKPLRFDDPYEVFANKDPRLFASVYLPGSPCQSTKIEWKRGVIENDNKRHVATSQPDGGNTVEINGVTYSTSGKDGGSDAGDASKTGFYQKKFWDETLTDMNMGKSETPWPVFRLGEIYLNLAEAAME